MPCDFVCIYEIPKRSVLSATANNDVTERLFVHQSQIDKIHKTDLFGYEKGQD